jgi:hypothetical protein
MSENDNAPVKPSKRVIIALPGKDVKDIEELLARIPFKFYVILLGRDEDDFIKNYVANNWTNLHYMSGDDCLFLSIYPPKKLDQEVSNYWMDKLGVAFEKVEEQTPTAAWSYVYARNFSVSFDKLPCLFIGVSLNKQDGFVVKIPEALKDDLTSYFQFIFQKIENCANLDESERLAALEKQIDKYYRWKLAGIYVKNHWMEYVKPKHIISAIIGQFISMIPGVNTAKSSS